MSLGNLLKRLNIANLYSEYIFEKFRGSKPLENKPVTGAKILEKPIISEILDDNLSALVRMDKLSKDHPAVGYLIKRKIPESKWQYLYLCHKYKAWANSVKHYFTNLDNDHPRLVIPYFNQHGKMIGSQARAFDNSDPKYYAMKLVDEERLIYGLDHIDYTQPIRVTEGVIDSFFIDNCIAVSGVNNMSNIAKKLNMPETQFVLIPDNEPRSQDLVKFIDKLCNQKYQVTLFPHTFPYKDINEAIQKGMSTDQISKIIEENTFKGLELQIHLNDWRKCEIQTKKRNR